MYSPSCQCSQRKIHWKSASSEMPVTISGVTSERYSAPVSSARTALPQAVGAERADDGREQRWRPAR